MAIAVQPAGSAQIHRHALAAPVAEMASVLQSVLTRKLAAYVTGVKDAKTITRWATGEVSEIRERETEQRLRTAYEIVRYLLSIESAPTVRAWFIGLDPYLGDVSPAEAIHAGNLKEALSAARAFAANG